MENYYNNWKGISYYRLVLNRQIIAHNNILILHTIYFISMSLNSGIDSKRRDGKVMTAFTTRGFAPLSLFVSQRNICDLTILVNRSPMLVSSTIPSQGIRPLMNEC